MPLERKNFWNRLQPKLLPLIQTIASNLIHKGHGLGQSVK